jgi:RHH-type rel operon transcriptional repressor/antitoxin RelB
MLALRLPPEIETRLNELAKRTGRSKSYYAREAVIEHLEDLEDVYLAEQRLIEIRAGRSKTVPLEEVVKENGLDD